MKPVLSLLFACLSIPSLAFAGTPEEFAKTCGELGRAAASSQSPSVRGEDRNWFFLTTELLHCGTGKFWEKPWAEVALNAQDPVPYMINFQTQLAEQGVELLLVPIPAKASIYPDKLDSKFTAGEPFPNRPYFAQIAQAGIRVLDLETVFRNEREAGKPMHCMQDAHFTPTACEVIAKLVVGRFDDEEWFINHPKQNIVRGPRETLTIVGDQIPKKDQRSFSETIDLQYCGLQDGGRFSPVEPDSESPVLLLGDSHTLVFQEGASRGMHSTGAGLLDQLQAEAGFAMDLIGVRGSGQKAARYQLYREAAAKPDYWKKKKLVIWCFSVRELTQSFDKLLDVPIQKK